MVQMIGTPRHGAETLLPALTLLAQSHTFARSYALYTRKYSLNAFMLIDVLDYPRESSILVCQDDKGSNLPLQHQKTMRMTTYIWMYCDRIHEFVILSIEVIELVEP